MGAPGWPELLLKVASTCKRTFVSILILRASFYRPRRRIWKLARDARAATPQLLQRHGGVLAMAGSQRWHENGK